MTENDKHEGDAVSSINQTREANGTHIIALQPNINFILQQINEISLL
jgi:hypothetical protein